MNLVLAKAALLISATPVAPLDLATIEGVQVPPEIAAELDAAYVQQGETAVIATPGTAEEDDPGAPPSDPDVIIVEGQQGAPPGDPLLGVNETTFEVSQAVDAAVVAPVAQVYEEDLPKPLRNGLRNFLRNLMEPVNALNYLLQLKPGKAVETLGRFAINSTLGIAGLIDVARREPFHLPYRRNGFSNTLGYYGVGPGPFLVLPLVGATTVRDLLGTTIDQSIVPFAIGAPFNTPYYAVPAYTINSLQFRMDFDERLEQINDTHDPYTALRESYLCLREADIAALHNRPPPRDCRIDVLMGYEESDLDAPELQTPVADAPQQVAPEPVAEPAPEADAFAPIPG